ncbi:polymer-forming cytoskeletal protein [Candidatus Altiarchaeota archaeon]
MKKNYAAIGLIAFILIVFSSVACAEEDSTMRFGGDVLIDNDVPTDLVVAGGQVTVNGNVAGDVLAFGGQITINGNVGGEVNAFGGNVIINGNVKGDLTSYGGSVKLNGVVDGNAELGGGDISMGPDAQIKGDLTYGSPQPASTFEEYVAGTVTGEEQKQEEIDMDMGGGFGVIGFIHGLITAALVGLVLLYYFPKLAKQLGQDLRKAPITNTILGVVAFPIIGILFILGFIILLFGWPLSVALMAATIIALLFCTIPVKLVIGEIIGKKAFQKELTPLKAYLLGLLVYAIVVEIPLLGALIAIIAVLLGFGTIFRWALGKKTSKKLPQS